MKFSVKLTCAVTLLAALCASVLGNVLLTRNFDAMLAVSCEQYARLQESLAYSLAESASARLAEDKSALPDAVRAAARGLQTSLGIGYTSLFITSPAGALYSSLPEGITRSTAEKAIAGDPQSHAVTKVKNVWYAGFVCRTRAGDTELTVFSVYDVTPVFAARARQQTRLFWSLAALLPVLAAVTAALCSLLTKNIRRLETAAAAVADGDYSRRSKIAGKDEIASLSRSFDRMADRVESDVTALRLSVRQREEFVSAFTHELKTPMTSMMGYSDVLRSQSCDAQTIRMASGYIYSETRRLADLSQKLLMLLGLSQETVSLAGVALSRVSRRLPVTLGTLPNEARLVWEGGEEGEVLADESLLLVLLRNLVQNAARARPRDGRVMLTCREEGERWLLCVEDTGCGIPAEELPHLTEAFYMVDKSRARAQGGSGIGLALCDRIARLHQTCLTFESVVGRGTKVSFYLQKAKATPHNSQLGL